MVYGEVLDVACGTGYGSRMLALRANVSGVDRDLAAVEQARSRNNGTFLVAEVPPVPFSDDTFDFVVSFETIEHIPDDLAFVREIRRVLRPGGMLLMSTPNAEISAPDGVPSNRWHVREYTRATLAALLTAADFEVREFYAQSFPPKLRRGHRLLWRLHGLLWMFPVALRSSARAMFGDSRVRPLSEVQAIPGYWLVTAVKCAGAG